MAEHRCADCGIDLGDPGRLHAYEDCQALRRALDALGGYLSDHAGRDVERCYCRHCETARAVLRAGDLCQAGRLDG